jgi:hypothetical protein
MVFFMGLGGANRGFLLNLILKMVTHHRACSERNRRGTEENYRIGKKTIVSWI